MMNKIELLLAMSPYDCTYQPKKKDGLYIYSSTEFILYGAGRVSEKRMKDFVSNVVTHRVLVSDPNSHFFTEKEFEHFGNHTIGSRDHIRFDFITVPRGKEELLIPYLDENCKAGARTGLSVSSFAYTQDGIVHGLKASQAIFARDDEAERIRGLEEIATWKHNPANFFNDFLMDSFAHKHFKNTATTKEIDAEFRRLSKTYHPDKGGEELMFKALSTARRYLKGQISASAPQKRVK